MPDVITPNPWDELRRLTPARIALGRAGGSVPTHELLDFQLAHARARDALAQTFDAAALAAQIKPLGVPTVVVQSAAPDAPTFLLRPDLGRMLDEASRGRLGAHAGNADLAVIVSDGLSALAAHRQTVPLLAELLPALRRRGLLLAPIVIARRGRVALQDSIGELLNARAALTLIGERPGLGAPDSLGAYYVLGPKPGNTDADRNCVSNIRPAGLPPAVAARTIEQLIIASLRLRISGVRLKVDVRALPA